MITRWRIFQMSSAPSTECRSHTEKRVPTNVLKTRAELHEPDTQEQGQTHKTQGIIAFLWKVLKKGTYRDNTPCWLPGVAEVLFFFCSQTWSRKIPHTVQQLSLHTATTESACHSCWAQRAWSLCSTTTETTAVRSPSSTTRGKPVQLRISSTAKNKWIKLF